MIVSRLIILLVSIFTFSFSAKCQIVEFHEIEQLQKLEKKPVMVLIGTSWCNYCQSMKHHLLRDDISSDLLNKFYVIFLDAEQKQPIRYGGKVFKFKPNGQNTGVHELAQELGTVNNQLSYPTICFLNQQNEIIFQHAGYLSPKALSKLFETISKLN
ncbi:thioredoxin family protein [Daejeonella oryzae]|uniref:thioredoxin family protein n=1 Tax=Daejeonella oryzae TaxID=1122943 RepID=UPI0004105A69|nr:thioredoxin fold domain-containing protein [Daejeonella oryzae]